MLRLATVPALIALAACGTQSNDEALQNAANQSDPAAAAVLENAAEMGLNSQQALERAGQAAAQSGAQPGAPPSGSVQARPNTREQPNRPDGGRPPEKVVVNAAEDQHAGHDMNNM